MSAPSPSPILHLRRLLGRVRRFFAVDTFDVFVRPVPREPTFAAPPGYEFRWGSAADVERCDPHHTELDERERAAGVRRLGFGHRVVLGLAAGTVVFTMWVNPRNLNVPGLMKRALSPGQWFIYKAFTSPDHRGKKLYEGGMRFVLSEMRAAGLRELVGYAHVKKAVSRRGLAALAFESAGRVTLLAWPCLTRVFLSKELVRRFPRALERSGAIPPARS
jgi:hypothetical protein